MLDKCKQAIHYFTSFQVSTHAASASFFFFVSVFPLLALILTLLRYLPLTYFDLLAVLDNVLPQTLIELVGHVLEELYTSNIATVISISGIVALWSASRGVFGILTGLNSILGSHEHRSYVRRRTTAIFYTFMLIIALVVTLILQVFGKRLVKLVNEWDLPGLNFITEVFHLRYLFVIGFLALFFMVIFAVFPARRMHLKDVVPGAFLTAVGWIVFSYLFSIYVNHTGGTKFYGSMTVVVMSLLWLYICMCILFYGGVVCLLTAEGKFNLRTAKEFFKTKKK